MIQAIFCRFPFVRVVDRRVDVVGDMVVTYRLIENLVANFSKRHSFCCFNVTVLLPSHIS